MLWTVEGLVDILGSCGLNNYSWAVSGFGGESRLKYPSVIDPYTNEAYNDVGKAK